MHSSNLQSSIKIRVIPFFLALFMIGLMQSGNAQVELEHLGLADRHLLSMDINFNIIATGSDSDGVHWQFESIATDSGWQYIALDSVPVNAVYPHKSGPLGWAISAGVTPEKPQGPYIYCSFMGEDFFPNSDGVIPEMTQSITDLDGFPDPTICGETYAVGTRILYRRLFADTTWKPVYNATVEGHFQTVKVRQEYPGVVLAGGADGFAGILLIKSTDFGEIWEDISPFGVIHDIDFAGVNADTIIAASSDKVLLTTDGGMTWETIYEDGISYHITEILYDADDNILYAGGGNVIENTAALFRSSDLGQTWQQIHLDTLGRILDLDSGSDDWVYFNTRDEGVFRFKAGTTGTEEHTAISGNVPVINSIDPNPVNRECSTSYFIPEAGNVRVYVSDIYGHEVVSIQNAYKRAGSHLLSWNAGALEPGIWLIVLDFNGSHVVGKVVTF